MSSKAEGKDVSGIKGPSVDVQVCGILGDISHMKKGRSAAYFEGEIMGEKKSVTSWF